MGITGNIEQFGNWEENKYFKLNCCNEKIWKGSIILNNFHYLEFKFVLISNNNIIRWQDGNNNIYYQYLCELILKNPNGNFDRCEYKYKNNELFLKCKWR